MISSNGTPIRILHVLGRLDFGGAEVMIMNHYRQINRNSIQFDFLIHTTDSCDFTDEVTRLGGRIFSVPKYVGPNLPSYIKSLHEFFKTHKGEFVAVHGHMGRTAAIYLYIAKRYGLFTIAHSHGSDYSKNMSGFLYKVFAFPTRYVADYYLACSSSAGRVRYGTKILQAANFRVMTNAFDIKKFIFSECRRKQVRKDLGLEESLVIGHVGRLDPVKNHMFLLDVFSHIVEKNSKARLLLVGDGSFKKDIEQRIEKLNLSDYVLLTGAKGNIADVLHAMDVFVFPSLSEGLGISLVEAQAAGLPCYVSSVVPADAKVTDLVQFVSLEEGAVYWADKILSSDFSADRKQYGINLKNSAYDIVQSVSQLEEFYLALPEMKRVND